MYDVELAAQVRQYLEAIPPEELSTEGLVAVLTELIDDLERRSDDLLRLHPLGPESLLFEYHVISGDRGFFHDFRFVIDTTHAEFGIVRVVYADREYPPERLSDIINSAG